MIDALGHRGPDGCGITGCLSPGAAASQQPRATFGHRRLAIIDLSERGAQPMRSRTVPVWLTYNGEIYNFAAIRRELEALGRSFRSDSDSEVVLQGYEEWGRGVLARLRGMFAFALWDGRLNELVLARDRFGIKPLYFHRSGGTLLFASEIRALLASGQVPRRLDHVALDQFLAYQTVPAPRTLVEGIEMLPPGHVMVLGRDGRCDQHRYWDLLESADSTADAVSVEEARRRTRELLVESAALHLVSDVDVGIFLSGGIDSSALVSLVRSLGATPRTFSVVFPGTPYDESRQARSVAAAFGADHAEIGLAADELQGELPAALAAVDHPSADGINTFVVSRAVHRAGIKVALSGLGGDELFGGYPSFERLGHLALVGRAWRHAPQPVRQAAAAAARTLGGTSVASRKRAALLESDGTLPETFPVLRQLFPPDERARLTGGAVVEASRLAGDPYVTLLRGALADEPHVGQMALVTYAESRTYMHDVLLRDTDQMGMHHGLEVRVPLLDHRLAEYVAGLPDRVKRQNGAAKPLLVESLPS
jgi:asparagine synthase (glutamine-hydrolysing)